ncbi:MAG: HlyC/CorC family transporter [Gemmatimonadaceae bacterium]|nr:HlyC/CorC family transporter [Gemmatimonadaceae bacterium]
MSLAMWAVAGGGAGLAALAAVADGALLADHGALAHSERNGLVPLPTVSRPVASRERAHRALSFARVVGHGVAGGALALALGLAERTELQALALLAVAGLITVALAESTARAIGDALGDQASERLRRFTRLLEIGFGPFVRLGEWVDSLFVESVSDAEGSVERREEAAAQFRDVINTDADVSGDERELLLGVFDFGETTAEEVMVPRVDIIGLERETPWSEVLDHFRSEQHSRVPVFDESIDEIVGILYAKDLLASAIADTEPSSGWQALMRPPTFVPPSKRIADLLREFRATGRHIVVVADEYGGTAGLVTIEDVLEELVGEIRDEYDDEERQVESEAELRFWVSGRLTLDDLSDALHHDFRRDDVTTVGGLVLELLGRVPRAGESLQIGPFRVIVERVIRRKIERIYLERLPGTQLSGDA